MVRTATADDVPAIAESLARAFDDDPIAVFANPSARSRPRRLSFFYVGRLRTLLPEELCFTDEKRLGAALWAPPDRWHLPLREQLRLVRLLSWRTPQIGAGYRRVERVHPREPHFYLSVLGVAPEAQGRGLGSALLAPMLERCDREGVGAYLESSKEENLAFYGRHGFRVTDELRFPGGPPLWPMWRDPR